MGSDAIKNILTACPLIEELLVWFQRYEITQQGVIDEVSPLGVIAEYGKNLQNLHVDVFGGVHDFSVLSKLKNLTQLKVCTHSSSDVRLVNIEQLIVNSGRRWKLVRISGKGRLSEDEQTSIRSHVDQFDYEL